MSKLPASLAVLVLAGCASYSGAGLKPGTSTEADVRQTMGVPALTRDEAGGGRELVYPKGPLGTQTFIAHVDAQGRLERIQQVLDDDHFQGIHAGQTREQVLSLIGPPGETMKLGSGNDAWTYRFVDTWGYVSEFSVTFNPAGIVVSKIAVRLDQGRDHDSK